MLLKPEGASTLRVFLTHEGIRVNALSELDL